MKKLILIILLFISIIAINADKIKNLAYNSMIALNIMKPCYRADQDQIEIFKQEGINYFIEDKKVTEDGVKKLANRKISNEFKIPLTSHHIYLSSKENYRPLNNFYLEKIKATYNKLNQLNPTWKHYFWTNDPRILPDEVRKLKGLEIKNPDEFIEHPLYKHLNDYLQKGEKITPYLAAGSDLLRLMALAQYGGMYNDMDYEIYNPLALLNLFTEFDYIGGRETTKSFAFYGNAFIASKANHPIISQALKLFSRNTNSISIPDYLKYPCSEHAKIYANGPLLLTLAYFTSNNIEGNYDIILPTWMIMNATFARFKNIDCNYDKVTKETFNKIEQNLEGLLKIYPLNAKEEGVEDSNIYYSIRDRKLYDIIGADMFCGGWSKNNKTIKKRIFYWN